MRMKKIAVGVGIIAIAAIGALLYVTPARAPISSQTVEEYVAKNISALSPVKEDVGGTFYVTQIEVREWKGVVSYEDGHNAYTADFEYEIDAVGAPRVSTFVIRSPIKDVPQQVTVTGIWECLPHKNKTGPQTLECALGIAIDQSDGHYAIDTQFMARYPVDYPTGTHVRVIGILTPVEQMSSIHKYDIDGVLSATTIEKI